MLSLATDRCLTLKETLVRMRDVGAFRNGRRKEKGGLGAVTRSPLLFALLALFLSVSVCLPA